MDREIQIMTSYRYVRFVSLKTPLTPFLGGLLARAHMIAFDCSRLIALREVHPPQDLFFVKIDKKILPNMQAVKCLTSETITSNKLTSLKTTTDRPTESPTQQCRV